MELKLNSFYNMDCVDGMRLIIDKTVDCCVTSPPYWGLRDYGVDGQLGLEDTPEQYVDNLVTVFKEVKRVLKDDGTLWLNLGDSYTGSGKGSWSNNQKQKEVYVPNKNSSQCKMPKIPANLKRKELVGIPWRVAFALQSDGWYLRQDIIWAKPNPMPESVKDRCTKSHEYIFLLSKSPKYYFNAEAISEPVANSTVKRLQQDIENQKGSNRVYGKTNGVMKAVAPRYGGNKYTANPEIFNRTKSGNAYDFHEKRNKRDVWIVSTKPFKEAHFATFPLELIEPCILAGCKEKGIVLDPFMGSGTVALASIKHNKNFIGFELNKEYCNMAEKRLKEEKAQISLFERSI